MKPTKYRDMFIHTMIDERGKLKATNCLDCDGRGWIDCECRECRDVHERECEECNGAGAVIAEGTPCVYVISRYSREPDAYEYVIGCDSPEHGQRIIDALLALPEYYRDRLWARREMQQASA